ncbi:MAG: hypothetical protein FJ296_00200, partial [Planctomycetes bacterium]|nr:hypothetical protein [Planctomycetota bacterium]
MPRSLRRLALGLVFALPVTLALGEVAARLADRLLHRDSSLEPPPDVSRSLMVPHPYVGYIPRPNLDASRPGSDLVFTQNSLGFRGPDVVMPKPPGTYRVACLGGSTTQGLDTEDDSQTWPARLQFHLQEQIPADSPYQRVEVINAGAASYTSMESFINLKTRLLPLDLDLVVDYDSVNDTQVVMRAGFKPDYTHVRRAWTPLPEPSLLDRWLGWSHLYGTLFVPEERRQPRRVRECIFVEDYHEIPLVRFEEMGPGFETFYWTMRDIVGVARVHGVPVMLCTFAYPKVGKFATPEGASQDIFKSVIQRLNAIIRVVADQDLALLVDLEQTGPSMSLQFVDVIHPNAEGHDLIARQVAARLLESGLLTRPRRAGPLPDVLRAAGP